MLTLDSEVRPDSDVVDVELEGGEMVLLHLQTRNYYSLNSTGMQIWKRLKLGSPLREISERLQSEFAVDLGEADQTVVALVDELISQQLVRLM